MLTPHVADEATVAGAHTNSQHVSVPLILLLPCRLKAMATCEGLMISSMALTRSPALSCRRNCEQSLFQVGGQSNEGSYDEARSQERWWQWPRR